MLLCMYCVLQTIAVCGVVVLVLIALASIIQEANATGSHNMYHILNSSHLKQCGISLVFSIRHFCLNRKHR